MAQREEEDLTAPETPGAVAAFTRAAKAGGALSPSEHAFTSQHRLQR